MHLFETPLICRGHTPYDLLFTYTPYWGKLTKLSELLTVTETALYLSLCLHGEKLRVGGKRQKTSIVTITARPSRAKVISLLPLRVGRRVLKELGHVATEAAVQLGGKELGRFRHGEDAVGALQAAHEVIGALHRPHRQPARW